MPRVLHFSTFHYLCPRVSLRALLQGYIQRGVPPRITIEYHHKKYLIFPPIKISCMQPCIALFMYNLQYCSIQTNSYQAILVTDGTRSYALFLYHCDLLQSSGAVIGYTASGNFYLNHPLSKLDNSKNIACNNRPHNDWSTVIYPIHYAGIIIWTYWTMKNVSWTHMKLAFGMQRFSCLYHPFQGVINSTVIL